jgi:hypothetical protein
VEREAAKLQALREAARVGFANLDEGRFRGLLPHGPHNVRDVLATHILKLRVASDRCAALVEQVTR